MRRPSKSKTGGPARWLAGGMLLACLAAPAAQVTLGDEAAWRAFIAWFRNAPPVRTNPFAAYAASLKAAGTPIGGTVTLSSTSGDGAGSGVASVAYQYRTSSSGTWTAACSCFA